MKKILLAFAVGGILGMSVAHGNFPGSWENGYRAGYSISQSKIAYERWIERHPNEGNHE